MIYIYLGTGLGTVIWISYMAYWFYYLPHLFNGRGRKIKNWVEKSPGRMLILDITVTILAGMTLSRVSDSITALIASSTIGFLMTVYTIIITTIITGKEKLKKVLP